MPVPYEQDLDKVTAVVEAAAEAPWPRSQDLRGAVLEAPRVVRVERLAETGLVLKVFGRVTPANRYSAAGALRRLILDEAARRGVVVGWRAVPQPEAATGASTTEAAAAVVSATDKPAGDPGSPASPDGTP